MIMEVSATIGYPPEAGMMLAIVSVHDVREWSGE